MGGGPDMLQMAEDLFFRDPHDGGYLPGREGVPLQKRRYRLADGRVLLAGNKWTFCLHFLYFLVKILYS
jgi:hypothetical protein